MKAMKCKLLAMLLSVALLAGCVGDVSYAAQSNSGNATDVSVELTEENETEAEETSVSGGNTAVADEAVVIEENDVSTGDSGVIEESASTEEPTATEESAVLEEPSVSEGDSAVTEDSAVSAGDSVVTEEAVSTEEQESLATVDISDSLLQVGGMLSANEKEGMFILPTYDAVSNSTYASASKALLKAYASFATSCDLSSYNISTSDIGDFVSRVLNSNPRYFYVDNWFSYSYSSGKVYTVYIEYNCTKSQAQTKLAEYDAAIDEIATYTTNLWSDLEKTLFINDYLARNCEYDTTYSKYDAYSVLVGKSAVCQGYALAYKALANELGLDCEVVTSSSVNHAWNMVCVNDKYYHVDTTWNDPLYSGYGDVLGVACHDNLLKSTAYFQGNGHYDEDDWGFTGGWKDSYATDTTYDTYFWDDMIRGFDYIGDCWYTGNSDDGIVKYSCDGAGFTGTTVCLENSNLYGFCGFGGNLYYADADNVYEYNLDTNTASVVYELDATLAASTDIMGFFIDSEGQLTCELYSGTVLEAGVIEDSTIVYNIAFDGNGATGGSMESMNNRRSGLSYALSENTFSRKGYTFAGWNTAADGSGIAYADGGSVKDLATTTGETVTLYAQWTPIKYAITYELNGGTNDAGNPTEYDISMETIVLKAPTKEGYTFAGWYTTNTYKKKVTEIAQGNTGEKKFYAKWTANKYSVVFDGNGSTSGSMSNLSCKYASTHTLTANKYKRSGYNFVGWNTAADGSGVAYTNKTKVKNLTAEADGVVTLYAQWELVEYKLTYKLNGGVNSDSNPVGYNAESATIVLENPTKEGYTFGGWYTKSNYNAKYKVEQIATGSSGNKTLYAKWTVNKYNIVFDDNVADDSVTGTMATLTNRSYGKSYALTTNKYKRDGYTFIGWNTEANGSGTAYTDKAKVKNLSSEDGATVALYAQWALGNYRITYKLNGGTNAESNPLAYDERFDTITLAAPVREGYTFGGWYTKSNYKEQYKVTEIAAGSSGAKTLYAKWTANKYTIVFDDNVANEGEVTGTMATVANRLYGKKYSLSANKYKRNGYTFTGWNTAADGSGTTYKNKAKVQNLSAEDGSTVTLYAQWKLNEYKIVYKLNGGTNAESNPAVYTIISDTITLAVPTKTGYTFGGWYTKSSCKEQYRIEAVEAGSTGNKTVYAKWTANKYNITFDGNGATAGAMTDLTNRVYGKSYTVTANKFKRDGYTFAGWNTEADGSGTAYKNKAKVKNLSAENGSTVTLYAQWKAK